jgi:hypothetical protein
LAITETGTSASLLGSDFGAGTTNFASGLRTCCSLPQTVQVVGDTKVKNVATDGVVEYSRIQGDKVSFRSRDICELLERWCKLDEDGLSKG